jgi:hypothetical protein
LPDAIRNEQLNQLMNQVQRVKQGDELNQHVQAILQADPSKAQDPAMMAILRSVSKNTGMPAPILPAQKGLTTPMTPYNGPNAPSDGKLPGINNPGQPQRIDTNALSNQTDQSIFATHAADFQNSDPKGRDALFTAYAGRPPTPQESAMLAALPKVGQTAQQVQTDIDSLTGKYSSQIVQGFKSGNSTAVHSAAQSWMAQMIPLVGEQQAMATIEPYLRDGIADLPPDAARKLTTEINLKEKQGAHLDELDAQIKALLPDRIRIADARLADIKAETKRRTQEFQQAQQDFPLKNSLLNAQVAAKQKELSQMDDKGAETRALADYYKERVTQISPSTEENDRASKALSQDKQNTTSMINNVRDQITKLQSGLGAMDPKQRVNVNAQVKVLQGQENALIARYNESAHALNTLSFGKGAPQLDDMPTVDFGDATQDQTQGAAPPAKAAPQPVGQTPDGRPLYKWADGTMHTKAPS